MIPQSLVTSMMVASVVFFLAVWLIILLSYKKLLTSLAILAVLVGWYTLVYFLGNTGFWGQDPLFAPFIAFGFVGLYFGLRFLYRLPLLQRIAESIPVHLLVGIQVFRFMGIGFLSFYALGLIPGEFALPTGWGDVLVGVTAVPVAWFLWTKQSFAKRLAIWWNYLGIADLTMAIILGIATFPKPFQTLPTQPDNLLIASLPLVMVPLFAVPLSLLIHLFTLRVLRKV